MRNKLFKQLVAIFVGMAILSVLTGYVFDLTESGQTNDENVSGGLIGLSLYLMTMMVVVMGGTVVWFLEQVSKP